MMVSYKLAMAALGVDSDKDQFVQQNISSDILARRFISRTLVLDSLGLTSHAAATAAFGAEYCSTSSSDRTEGIETEGDNVTALRELSIQLHHFKEFLYDGFLNSDSTFIGDWLGSPISDTIFNILQSWLSFSTSSDEEHIRQDMPSSTKIPIVTLLMNRIRPMSEGPYCLYQSCSHEELCDRLLTSIQAESGSSNVSCYDSRSIGTFVQRSISKYQGRGIDNILMNLLEQKEKKSAVLTEVGSRSAVLPVEDAFERAIVSALGGLVRDSEGSLALLQTILEVASASLPTMARSLRCLRSPMRLASLVVTACTFFDNTYVSSLSATCKSDESRQFLPVMWLLLETTPASLAAFDIEGMPKESEIISEQLDAIQDALSVCDVVQRYMTPPAVFILLGDQSEREGSRSAISSSDSSHIRLARRMYMKDLLTGCGFLTAGLSESCLLVGEENSVEIASATTSSSPEVLTNMVSMGQALILRMCFEFGRRQEASSPSRSFDGDESSSSSSSWKKVAHDVMSLCSYFKPLSVPPLWGGHAFLQCLMHYDGVNADLRTVLKTIRETDNIASIDSDESDQNLGSILGTLGVQCQHIERLVLKRAVDIFNSVSSCSSEELREVDQLLALLPQQSPCPAVASAVRLERALMELVGLLSNFQVDLLPLQLRLLSPADVAAKLLEQRPQAYLELNNKGDYDELYSSVDYDQAGDSQDILVRRTLLRDKQPPGARLVRILLALHPESGGSACASASSPARLHTAKMEIYLELLFAAISMSDMEGAYCLCRSLLTASAADDKHGNASSLPASVLERISESALLVVGMLDLATEDLHRALRYDLLSLVLASTPVSELERISSLWRQPPVNPQHSADDTLDADEIHISAARLALLDVIGKMLRNSDDNGLFSSATLGCPAEVVASAGSDTSRLSDAVGHLLLVEDSDSVHALIEKLYADLDKKLSSTLMQEKLGQGSGFGRSNHKLDEALVSKVVSKGFSRNSAKRAVLATRGEGFKEALSWAVEHSRDDDFEFPIAETVQGALLSRRDEGLVSFNPESMKSALMVLANVSEMYQRHHSTVDSKGKSHTVDDTYPQPFNEAVEWSEDIERLVSTPQAQLTELAGIEIETDKDTEKKQEIILVNGSDHAPPAHPESARQTSSITPEQLVETDPPTEPQLQPEIQIELHASTSVTHIDDNEQSLALAAPSTFYPAAPQNAPDLKCAPTPAIAESEVATVVVRESVAAVSATEGICTTSAVKDLDTVGDVEVPTLLVVSTVPVVPTLLVVSTLPEVPTVPVVLPPLVVSTLPEVPTVPVVLPPLVVSTLPEVPARSVSSKEDDPIQTDLCGKPSSVSLVSPPAAPTISAPFPSSSPLPASIATPTAFAAAAPNASPRSSVAVSAVVAAVSPHDALPPPPSRAVPIPPPATKDSLPFKMAPPTTLSTLKDAVPLVPPNAVKTAVPNTLTALSSSNNTVLKAHLASRLRGALDVAEDFTGIGVNAGDLARAVANREASEEADEEIGGPCDQVFQVSRSLATHRRTAAFEFLPQLLLLLPTFFQTEVAMRAERLIFGSASSSSSIAGGELERAKWAMAALRLLTYHTSGDALTYTVCIPVLYAPLNTRRTILLLAYLYKELDGSNLNALMGTIKIATDHLMAVLAVDSDTSAEQTTEIQVKEAARAIQRASTPEGVQVSTITEELLEERAAAVCAASVTAALKQLQEDVAVLRRVSRIPDSGGVYAKALLKLKADDLYFFQDAGLNSTHLNELDLKRKYRQQALLALGPYLYPQTITHWVRVIGRQLGLGSADFSFQYACCTLSATSARCFKNGGAGSNSGDSEAWSLLATEFTSCVRRMKPEQTYALCLVVAGITPLGASKYSGCEMLFPLVPVPDLGVGILLSTIHAAVQKQAVPLAAGSTEATTPASTTSLYTLTAPLAHKLLPSVACIRNYLDAIRSSFSSSSPIRVELLRHCLDSSSALDDVFVSILLSDCCTGDAVMRLLKASVELDHAEEGRSQVISVGTPSSKTDAAIARVSAKSADRISLLLASTRVPPEGDNTSATATVLAAAECLLLNAHLNFGPVTAGNITRSLYKMIEESSTSLHPAANGDSVAEEEDRVTISHLDCCLAVTQALNTYLSKIKTESPPVEGTSELKEIGRTAGATTNELLVTRRTVTQLQLLVESDYWREDSSPVGRIEVGLVSSGSEHGGLESYYSLDSSEDREQLFLRVVSLASEVPPSEAVIAVRAIMRLLRCWGLSRSAGSLKVALEAPLSPVPLFSTTSVRTIPGTAYPSWMGNNFHLLSWGKVIEISCKNRLYLDILEVVLIDIDTDPVCGHQPTGQSGGESTRYLAQTIGALAVDQTVPANYRHSFGLMAGGELAKQAARDLERDVLATTHSSSFSLSLFVLLLCLHDKEVVQTVARSSVLLAALVRLNSKCLEARLLSNLNSATSTRPELTSRESRGSGIGSRSGSGSDGSSIFSTFLSDLCSVSDSPKAFPLCPTESSHRGTVAAETVSTGRNGQCALLPLVLSPSYLAAMLLAGGYFSPAAHVHWTVVVRRPQGLYTADAAASLLFAHMSAAALPFYLSLPSAPEEVVERTWGWARWGSICHHALHT